MGIGCTYRQGGRFSGMAWTSPISKTLNITGNVEKTDNNNPAVRINSGGQGEITMNILSGGQTVRGWQV